MFHFYPSADRDQAALLFRNRGPAAVHEDGRLSVAY